MISGARLFRAGLFLALLVIGMYLLLKPPHFSTRQPPTTEEIGRMSASGPFWVRQNGDLKFHEVRGGLAARELQTLRIPAGSEIHAELAGGAVALFQENTLAILDRTDKGYEVLVFEGGVQVLQQGTTPITVIHSKLKPWSQEEVDQSDTLSDPELEILPETETSVAVQNGQLSDEYIREVLGRQQRFLRSCFIKYFQRKNGQVQSGRVVLHLLIENSGKVQSTDVMNSEINDEGYLSCLQSVALRTRFRAFEGPPLSVQYPIDLKVSGT